jgi:CRISPR system Cascade subunit CasE
VSGVPYLSRIWLNPLRTGTQRMLRNPQVLHAAILGGISRQPVSERVLWRLESDSAHRLAVLVLTETAPSWHHLIEQAGWPGADEPQALIRPYEPLLASIALGREFAFRLKANPVTATRTPARPSPAQQARLAGDRPRGVRVPHRTAASQLTWLASRADNWGFAIPIGRAGEPDVAIISRERLQFAKPGHDGRQHHVTISTATFEGRCRVTDPEAARRSLLSGVGPGRAYGCGLITLAPATAAHGTA